MGKPTGLLLLIAMQVAQENAQPGPLWILGQVGIIGAITVTFGMLHRSVVKAYEKSADKSERIAELERQRADTANAQLIELLRPMKHVGGE